MTDNQMNEEKKLNAGQYWEEMKKLKTRCPRTLNLNFDYSEDDNLGFFGTKPVFFIKDDHIRIEFYVERTSNSYTQSALLSGDEIVRLRDWLNEVFPADHKPKSTGDV